MKLRRKVLAAVSSLAVLAAVLLAGCATQPAEGNALKETGILTLSVNPEIQIEYNKKAGSPPCPDRMRMAKALWPPIKTISEKIAVKFFRI